MPSTRRSVQVPVNAVINGNVDAYSTSAPEDSAAVHGDAAADNRDDLAHGDGPVHGHAHRDVSEIPDSEDEYYTCMSPVAASGDGSVHGDSPALGHADDVDSDVESDLDVDNSTNTIEDYDPDVNFDHDDLELVRHTIDDIAATIRLPSSGLPLDIDDTAKAASSNVDKELQHSLRGRV